MSNRRGRAAEKKPRAARGTNKKGFMNLVESDIDTKRLRDIKLADKPKIDFLLSLAPNPGCENCFANLFMWGEVYGLEILEIGERRAVVYNGRDKYLYFPLGGLPQPAELAEICAAFARAGLVAPRSRIYNVPPYYPQIFPSASELFDFDENPDEADYLYDVERQIALSGPKLRKKRNHIKHFLSQNPQMRVEPLCEGNFARAMRFMDAEDEKKCLFAEEVAIGSAFANFRGLGLYGCVLYSAPDKIAAAAVMGEISGGAHSVHFEKSDKLSDGASQMIVRCEAEAIRGRGGKFMNREQDLGDPNLRRAKESLDPDIMYRRLGARPKNA